MTGGLFLKSLDRYILRQLLFALLAVTCGLTALTWLTQSLRFVELVVNHGLSLLVFLRLTGLLIPSFIAVILPITVFVVTQFVYHRLASDRELIVMRTAGLSPFALARPALILAVLVMGAVYALNLWLVPASLSAFRNFQWEIRNRMAAFLLQEGVFNQLSDSVTVYVRSRDPDGLMHGILINDTRDKDSPVTILAEGGRLLDGPDGLRAVLTNGTREVIDRKTGRLDILTFKQNIVSLADATNSASPRLLDMSEASLHQLLHPPQFLSAADHQRWIAEASQRLASPLTAVSYAMVALLSVLTGAFRRQGSLIRPLVAIGTMICLLAIGLAAENLAARNNALIPLIWLQAVVPAVICGWMLFGGGLLSALRQPFSTRSEAAG